MARAGSALAIVLGLFAGTVPLSIAISQGLLALALLLWIGGGARFVHLPILVPFSVYASLSLLSAVASDRPLVSLVDCKQFLLVSVLVLIGACHDRLTSERVARAFVVGSVIATLWGVASYLASPGGLLHRARGPAAHYLTFAGVTMLATMLAVSWLIRPRSRVSRLGALLVVLTLLAGLEVSYARSAWLGTVAGALVVIGLGAPRALPWVGLVLALAALTAPASMRARASSIIDLDANRDRFEMVRVGRTLVREQPWLGVGPDRVADAYARVIPSRPKPHLHNNALQIAVERGMPAFLAWLWLVVHAAIAAYRARADAAVRALAEAALGGLVALLVAGLFEYNFGDSEVLMSLLILLGLGIPPATTPPQSAARPSHSA